MSRLSKVYEAMETLRREGLSFDELEEQVNSLEEELIQKEILPIVTKSIAPVLKEVQRELIMVVDYVPGAPISVHLSRKRNFTAGMMDTKEILPDPQVEHREIKKRKTRTNIAPPSRLRIIFPDGSVIQEPYASETLREFVLRVGVSRVRALGMKINLVPLISNTLDKKYSGEQKELGNGWYLMTCSDTRTKKRDIEKIASALGIKLKVEII